MSELLAELALRPRDEAADSYLRVLTLTNAAAAVGLLGDAQALIDNLPQVAGHPGDYAFKLASQLHARTQDDFHPLGRSHIGAVTLAATLAFADRAGERTLDCLAAGYEVMCAISTVYSATAQRRGYRPTGMFGPFGAAASAAVALGLDRAGIANAIGLASTMSAGTNQSWISGTDEWLLELSAAARAGVDAALLTEAGAMASPVAIEGPAGWARAFFEDAEATKLAAALHAPRSLIKEVATKPYPVSGIAQVATHLGCELHDHINGEVPDSIVVTMSDAEVAYPGSSNRGPFRSRSDALMSVAFCVACGLTDGLVPLERLDHPNDPRLRQVIDRIELRPDPAIAETEATLQVAIGGGTQAGSGTAAAILYPSWNAVQADVLARRSEAEEGLVGELREALERPRVDARQLTQLLAQGTRR